MPLAKCKQCRENYIINREWSRFFCMECFISQEAPEWKDRFARH